MITKASFDPSLIDPIMARAIEINQNCEEACRDFAIMTSRLWPDTLLLRWTTINIDNIDNPIQCYRYECFSKSGTPQHCSVHYSNQDEANVFFESLEPLYRQSFASDHLLPKAINP